MLVPTLTCGKCGEELVTTVRKDEEMGLEIRSAMCPTCNVMRTQVKTPAPAEFVTLTLNVEEVKP